MTRLFRFAALAALFALPLTASAQRASGERGAHHLDRLTERLDLTGAQVAMVRAAMEGERTPGSSWDLAARLAPTLSAAQLETLKTPRERGARGERGRGAREASGERSERQQERAAQREQRRAERQTAREAALGLTSTQKQALESARAARQRPGADVLTDEQETVLLVHRALSGPRGGRRSGRRGGRRGGRR